MRLRRPQRRTRLFGDLEYEFVEECLLEDRANFVRDELEGRGNSVRVVKTELGWAVYSRPKA